MPKDMTETSIVPIIKKKCRKLADSINYRPIAIATILSKLFESVSFYKCVVLWLTCDKQFGFKPKHSTDIICINEYTHKHAIQIATNS